MELKDIISKAPAVAKDMSIKRFVELLVKQKVDLVPVVENDVVVGVVSEKDLIKLVKVLPSAGMKAVLSKNIPKDMVERKVSDIMTHNPITARSTSSINDIINLMSQYNMKRIVAVDENKKYIGIVQVKDIFRKFLETEKSS